MKGYDIHTSTFRDYFNHLIFIHNQIIKVIAMISQYLPKMWIEIMKKLSAYLQKWSHAFNMSSMKHDKFATWKICLKEINKPYTRCQYPKLITQHIHIHTNKVTITIFYYCVLCNVDLNPSMNSRIKKEW